MSVLNRAMFNQTVNRQEGSPPSGEENFFERFASLLRGQKSDPIRTEEGFTVNEIENILNTPASSSLPVSDDSTVYNFGEYGGTYDLKEEGFQRVLRNYLPEGADLFVGNPRDYILSPEGMDAIELFKADILKTQEANRAMGSPITGEGINGLKKLDDMRFRQMGSPMQGEMAQPTQAMPQQNPENVGIMQGFEDDAKTIVDAGSEKKEEFDKAEDYEQLMNTIRGDNKSEDQRRDELAEIVGEKDADDTPESVLALVQPVIQMLDTPEVRQEGIGATPQAFAMGGPVYRDDGTGKEGETSNNDDALNNLFIQMLLSGNTSGANIPSLATGFQKNLPVMQNILGRDPDRTAADTFFNIARSGFGLAAGMTPQEALLLGLQGQQKIGAKEEARDLAIKQAALGEASKDKSFAQQLDLAIKKEQAKKKDTKGSTFVVGSGVEVPKAVSSLLSSDQISAYPDGTNIFVDEKNKLSINIPAQADQEAYYDTENQKIVFLTDREYEDLQDKTNITTVSAGLSFTKLAKLEDGKVVEGTIKDIRNTQQDTINDLLEEGYVIISNSFEVNKDREGGSLFADGGIVKRSDGSPEDGENAPGSDYEAILADAETALKDAGVVFPALTDTDKSFFNSLYASTLESLNDLKRVKELMAADPSLTGYTGLAQETLTNFATLINDMDNYMGDKVFPDDAKGQPKFLQYFTKPEIRELKFKVAELSDAVADILSLRGKRGTTADVRGQALKRTDLTGFYGSDVAFEKIDSLTDYLTDRVKVFGMLSGNFEPGEKYDKFVSNITTLNNAIKNINPQNYEGKKTTFTLEDLESIVGE
tara:strand:+ start:1103 stop:3565 length:2463 start_codon:yes stop_codon:yes gene_type:complete